MSDAPSPHLHPPQQERSRKTLERLVSAARELIAEDGVEAATVSRIVERADSSVGSFYARFDGRDDLLRYLEERVWSEARERWEEAARTQPWEELDLEGVLRTVARLLVRVQVEDAGARRALGREGGSPTGGEEERRFHALLERDVVRLLLDHDDEIAHPRPEWAARFAFRWTVGGVRELLARPARSADAASAPGLDPDEVVEEIERALFAYLGRPERSDEEREDVDFFEVWQ